MVSDVTGFPEEIRSFIQRSAAQGADVVKMFATKSIREGGERLMSDEQIRAACEEARAVGKRSVVHAHGAAAARTAVLAGCTTIEHGTRLTDEVLDLMVERGTYYDPQFFLLNYYIANQERFIGIDNYTREGFAHMEEGLDLVRETFKGALARNVQVVFGSDAVAGVPGRNSEELIYRVRHGGQDPMAAIVSATSRAAASLGLQDRLGAIAPGMEAESHRNGAEPAEGYLGGEGRSLRHERRTRLQEHPAAGSMTCRDRRAPHRAGDRSRSGSRRGRSPRAGGEQENARDRQGFVSGRCAHRDPRVQSSPRPPRGPIPSSVR